MLSENIKKLRTSKGLSQEELATSLNVVRQTVSKWEKGLSVPDSEMLITLAKKLDTTVSVLLGETISETEASEIQILSKKLELLNEQLVTRNESKQKIKRYIFITLASVTSLYIASYIVNEIYYFFFLNKINSNVSVSIIGGANAPTTMFVASNLFNKLIKISFSIIIAIVSWIGFYKTKRK